MAGNQTNTANIGILATEDTTSNVLVNRSFAPSMDAKSGVYGTWILNSGAPFVIFEASATVPQVLIAYQCYVRNLSPVGGGQMGITVGFNTQIGVTSINLYPGDVFLYWNCGGTLGASAPYVGIVALNAYLVTAGGTANFEYFIGG